MKAIMLSDEGIIDDRRYIFSANFHKCAKFEFERDKRVFRNKQCDAECQFNRSTRVKFILDVLYEPKRKPFHFACRMHECGVCPTYFQKICGIDFSTKSTFIFDNECIMKLYNCKRKTEFVRVNYERCLFFGNFAYVHGLNHDDYDYGDHVTVKYVKKNPDFVK